jgi:hypothetical protein
MGIIPSRDIANNIIISGLFEPVEYIKNLQQIHYDHILEILTNFVEDTINVSKHFSQINTFKSLSDLNNYIIDNNLMVNGQNIKPSNDMIKAQMIFAMLYGVIYKLCGSRYIEITNKTMRNLFYIDVSES